MKRPPLPRKLVNIRVDHPDPKKRKLYSAILTKHINANKEFRKWARGCL